MNNKKPSQFYLLLILGLLSAIGPFSIDMYLPAFPAIAKGLHTSVASVMLSLSSFFLGISIGQLFYGPLLERFGRKPPLYVGLVIYVMASLGCAAATSIEMLIISRLFQALGGCVGMVASRAMVRDLFEVKDNAKVFSTLMLVVAVSPIIAPTLGGYISASLGWRYVFGMLMIVILLIILGIYLLLPESKAPNKAYALQPLPILKNYASILTHPQFSTFSFTGAIASAGLYAYIGGSPHVFMDLFSVTDQQYGWIFAIIAIGLVSATQVNNRLLKKYSSAQIIEVVLWLQTGIGILLVLLPFLGWTELYTTIFLIFLYLSCQGFLFPNTSALSMAEFGHNAGSASALMGFIQMSIGALMSSVVSVLQNDTLYPMVGVMAACSFTATLLYRWGRKVIRYRASQTLVEEEEVELMQTL